MFGPEGEVVCSGEAFGVKGSEVFGPEGGDTAVSDTFTPAISASAAIRTKPERLVFIRTNKF